MAFSRVGAHAEPGAFALLARRSIRFLHGYGDAREPAVRNVFERDGEKAGAGVAFSSRGTIVARKFAGDRGVAGDARSSWRALRAARRGLGSRDGIQSAGVRRA